MRPEYYGVKYYSPNDLSLGLYFEKATVLLDSLDVKAEYTDINYIIELYNVYQIITSPGIKPECATPYLEKANTIMPIVARCFHAINNETLLDCYHKVCINYIDDFWTLLEKYKVYKDISDLAFEEVLFSPETTLSHILEHKQIVKHYDRTIADYMRHSDQTARIIISKFLEKHFSTKACECYIPSSLKPNEFEPIIDRYIESGQCNVGVLQLVAYSQNSTACPLSDKLRQKAINLAKEYWDKHGSEGISISYGWGVSFDSYPETVSYEEVAPLECQVNYDVDWIKENLDYPTLLNNFIYLFGFVDTCYRCSFVSIESKLGLTERFFGVKGVREYVGGTFFRLTEAKSSAELRGYTLVLSEFNISIEDLISWFFLDYLKTEFAVEGFVINLPSPHSTFLERCKLLASEMDAIFKQFGMYVQDHSIDRELLEMSSNPVDFREISSMIKDKYAYANSNDIVREQHLMFSDQSSLSYLPQKETAKNFYSLLIKETVRKTDYPGWAIQDLQWLETRNTIKINEDGVIIINEPRVNLLRDLYNHEVICTRYYKGKYKELVDSLVASGDIRTESRLFSIPEQNYLSYVLNKAMFSNGLDLRNRYIHGTYPKEEKQQERDYIYLLKIFIVVVLKINEEFCLTHPLSQDSFTEGSTVIIE